MGTYPVREKKAEHQHAPIDLLVLAKKHRGVHHSMTLTPITFLPDYTTKIGKNQ